MISQYQPSFALAKSHLLSTPTYLTPLVTTTHYPLLPLIMTILGRNSIGIKDAKSVYQKETIILNHFYWPFENDQDHPYWLMIAIGWWEAPTHDSSRRMRSASSLVQRSCRVHLSRLQACCGMASRREWLIDSEQWILMDIDGPWWILMFSDLPWWLMMIGSQFKSNNISATIYRCDR